MPVYNVERYLKETIKSVLKQTFTDFELILVDDGSKDNSGKICDEFAKQDNRIKVIHKENGGVSSARNAGIENALGEFVGFVDSDDIISEVMYEGLFSLAKQYGADIVQCTHNRDVNKLNHSVLPENIEVYDNVGALKQLYIRYYTNGFSLCSKIYKKEVFSGIRFPEGRVFEDDEVIPHLLYKAKKVVMVENDWYCYMKRDNSIITGVSKEGIYALTDTLQKRMEFFKSIDKDLYTASAKHFFHYLKIKFGSCYTKRECFGENDAVYFHNFILKNFAVFYKNSNRYDRISLILLKLNCKAINDWIGKNDFEPIQSMIRKIKHTEGRT